MSRSNPSVNLPNPSKRWFEWNGELGTVRYYDKEAKQNVDLGSDFTFILLDELATVKGWHDASASGIYSNEVRDTRQEILVVRAFKGGTLAEGIYQNIRDRVNNLGGHFTANCYVAYKEDDGSLSLGSLQFKGAALGAWMEFRKANRSDLYKKAIRIKGFTEGKKGKVTFRMPVFLLKDISAEMDKQSIGLDLELQEFLKAYLKRPKREQVESAPKPEEAQPEETTHQPVTSQLTDDDIPF